MLAVFVLAISAMTQTRATVLTWNHSTRDVYVDGELDPSAQVLACESPSYMALLASKLERAVVLSINERKTFLTPKSSLDVAPDHLAASSASNFPKQDAGVFAWLDGSTYVFQVDGKSIVIRPHQGLTGGLSEQRLFEAVPAWRSLMDEYKPAETAVAAMKSFSTDAELTLVFGTWCSDSKNYMPKLLKALKAAGNGRLKVKMIGVDQDFHEPVSVIQSLAIINVPTVIISREGRELGRVIETPATGAIEEDVAAILTGKPLKHNGRWDRGPLVARGAYSMRDSGGAGRGTEIFELYRTAEMGYLLHSEITSRDLVTEVWHRIDAGHRPAFVEVTKRRGTGVMRARLRFDNKTMTVRLRGNESGTIDQTVALREDLSVTSPSAASAGWAAVAAMARKSRIHVYVLREEFESVMGLTEEAGYDLKGEETAHTPAGDFRTRRITAKIGEAMSDLWLDQSLNIPIRIRNSQGLEWVLTSFERIGSSKANSTNSQ